MNTGTCTVKYHSGSEPLCALTMAHSGKSLSGVGDEQARTRERAGVDDDATIAQILSQLLAGQLRLERDLLSLREAQTETHAAVLSIRKGVDSNSSLVVESSPMGQNPVFFRSSLRPEVKDGDESNVEPGGSQTDAERQVGTNVPAKELPTCVETLSDVSVDSVQLTRMFEIDTGVSQDETERGVGEARWPTNVVRRKMSNATCGTVVEATLTDRDELDKRISRGLQSAAFGSLHRKSVNTSQAPVLSTYFQVIHPHSKFRLLLDYVSLCILAYDLTSTPLILAWDVEVAGALFVMSVVIASWWTVDIFFSFRTGFFSNGVLVMSHTAVVRRYLRWFSVDATITLVDWSGVVVALTVDNDQSSGLTSLSTFVRIVKTTKVLRLLSFLRVGRFLEPLERLGDQFVSKVLYYVGSMVLIFVLLVIVNHVLACAWYSLARFSSTDTGYSWTDMTLMSDAQSYGDCDFWFQYFTAFHWTLTQMTPGSMPVQPMNSKERVFNIICLFLGLLFFSSVISSMTTALTQLKMLAYERERKINQLDTFFRQKAISNTLAVTVKKQVVRRMSQRKPMEWGDIQVLPMLSLTLRDDLMFDLCKHHLRGQELFRLVEQTDPLVLRNIAKKAVSFKALLPQDVLFVHDTPCEDSYVVTSGAIRYEEKFSQGSLKSLAHEEDATLEVMPKGWLCWASLWSHWVHVGKAEAVPISEVVILNSCAVLECIERVGELKALFESYSVAFHQRLVSASPAKAGRWPNDVQVPLTMYGEIVLGMQQWEQKFVGSKALEKLDTNSFLPWLGLSHQRTGELEQEVLSGQCVLVENADGQAERVVAFTGLRLLRRDGHVLVVLAKKRFHGGPCFEAEGQLPGVKQDTGELPSQALSRMLLGQLRPYAKELKIGSLEREDRYEESARFKIATKYIRVIYSGFLPDGFRSDTLVAGLAYLCPATSVFTPSSSRDRLKKHVPDLHECHMLSDSRGQYLCAFLAPETVVWLRKNNGRRQLALWVASLPPILVDTEDTASSHED